MSIKVNGIRLGTTQAGIKRPDRDDLLVIEISEGSTCSAVFTQNAFCAAPVVIAREHLNTGHGTRWLLINSGNANAGTGVRGIESARATCHELAMLSGGKKEQVLPFSTGVIGEYLPVEKIALALPHALSCLEEDHWEKAACAIMTTDTRPKIASRSICLHGESIVVTGIAKGAGMIHPNMATMLAFVGTNAKVDRVTLQTLLREAADDSFNSITVDGDTSTNDALVLLASGHTALPELTENHPDFPSFAQAVREVCSELAEAIIRDGEGATKFIRIVVQEAYSREEAQTVGKTIAHSPLVKTAFFASDPNWGRLLAAVGRAGIKALDIHRVSLWLDAVQVVAGGERAADYTEEAGAAVMARPDITVRVTLGRGNSTHTTLTCDFSYDYVRINAEYRT